jgi:hypothetical protein
VRELGNELSFCSFCWKKNTFKEEGKDIFPLRYLAHKLQSNDELSGQQKPGFLPPQSSLGKQSSSIAFPRVSEIAPSFIDHPLRYLAHKKGGG